ncbi:histidine kinase [Bifidobacterium imperatoris]|uniref:Sensor-like histidine kinase SenX3 n=2 Tax=Bifidobacterium imperatoris TaxID=2020965 RepID=A0A2N5ISJ4_9BIFI|nr:histidine kinase [Bifidobacterium imperatoris]
MLAMTQMPLAAVIVLIVLSVALLVVIALVVIGVATQRITLNFGHDDADDTDDLSDDTAALLSMLPGTSIVVDDHDGVVRCSPAAYHLGVVEEDTIVDSTVLDAVHEARKSGGKRQFDLTTSTPERYASERGGNEHVTAQSVTRPNWLKVTVARISEKFVIVLISDVSEIVRFGQVRDSFITNVSEQLLKPTQALSQLADSLEHGDLDQARIAADARQVRSSCNKLNHMVADLLLLIRAQEPITPSSANRLNVMEQLRATVKHLQPEAEQSGVQLMLKGDDALVINGLADQIDSAVTKLVENAIGYSKEHGVVSVSASRSKDGDRAVIRVIDQGAGIAKRDQSRIFERFYRGASQTERTAEGVGLGLAIVKHVALTHHGDVSVWSSEGQGSTFSLSLPLAQ